MFYHFNKFKYKVKLTVLKKTNTFQLKALLWYSLIFIDFRSSSSCLATWYKAKDQCLACLIRLTLAENIKRSAIQLVCAVLDTKKTDVWRGRLFQKIRVNYELTSYINESLELDTRCWYDARIPEGLSIPFVMLFFLANSYHFFHESILCFCFARIMYGCDCSRVIHKA